VGGTTAPTTVVTIGTRNLDTVLSLKDGETSIIGGLIQDTKSNNKQKISFLGDIPIIGSLLTNTDSNGSKDELVLSITPHIVHGITVPDRDVASFWSGKEDEPSTINPYAAYVQEPEIQEAQPVTKALPLGLPSPVIPAAPITQAQPSVSAGSPPPTAQSQSPQVPGTQPGMVLNITAPPVVKLNERFSVDVAASNVTNLYSAPFVFSYDPALLDFRGASEGPFLKYDGKPTSFQAINATNNGKITVNIGRVGNVGGINGVGTLVSFKFKAKKEGEVNLGLSNVNFTDPAGKPLGIIPFNTIVEVK
jgi:general secretion pathway protein D